jgi:metallophosphoesterase (TIGR00282 family)
MFCKKKRCVKIKVIFIGDIVGSVGRVAIKFMLHKLKSQYPNAIIIVNGENAASGKGITSAIAKEFYELGIHGITLGNHAWDQKDIFNFIDHDNKIIRPANFPQGTPGKGMMIIKYLKDELVVINIQGRTFLTPIDCPFHTIDLLLEQIKSKYKCILVDFHAEATSEKIAMGWHLDGRVSALIGTHTHVQTNDNRILPNGSAYITDVGMVGARDGVLGMQTEAVLRKFKTQLPTKFQTAEGKWHFHGVILDIDSSTGKASQIQLMRHDEDEVWLD